MEYRSAASFSNGANRKASLTNGDFLPMVSLTIGICLCILDMCEI